MKHVGALSISIGESCQRDNGTHRYNYFEFGLRALAADFMLALYSSPEPQPKALPVHPLRLPSKRTRNRSENYSIYLI